MKIRQINFFYFLFLILFAQTNFYSKLQAEEIPDLLTNLKGKLSLLKNSLGSLSVKLKEMSNQLDTNTNDNNDSDNSNQESQILGLIENFKIGDEDKLKQALENSSPEYKLMLFDKTETFESKSLTHALISCASNSNTTTDTIFALLNTLSYDPIFYCSLRSVSLTSSETYRVNHDYFVLPRFLGTFAAKKNMNCNELWNFLEKLSIDFLYRISKNDGFCCNFLGLFFAPWISSTKDENNVITLLDKISTSPVFRHLLVTEGEDPSNRLNSILREVLNNDDINNFSEIISKVIQIVNIIDDIDNFRENLKERFIDLPLYFSQRKNWNIKQMINLIDQLKSISIKNSNLMTEEDLNEKIKEYFSKIIYNYAINNPIDKRALDDLSQLATKISFNLTEELKNQCKNISDICTFLRQNNTYTESNKNKLDKKLDEIPNTVTASEIVKIFHQLPFNIQLITDTINYLLEKTMITDKTALLVINKFDLNELIELFNKIKFNNLGSTLIELITELKKTSGSKLTIPLFQGLSDDKKKWLVENNFDFTLTIPNNPTLQKEYINLIKKEYLDKLNQAQSNEIIQSTFNVAYLALNTEQNSTKNFIEHYNKIFSTVNANWRKKQLKLYLENNTLTPDNFFLFYNTLSTENENENENEYIFTLYGSSKKTDLNSLLSCIEKINLSHQQGPYSEDQLYEYLYQRLLIPFLLKKNQKYSNLEYIVNKYQTIFPTAFNEEKRKNLAATFCMSNSSNEEYIQLLDNCDKFFIAKMEALKLIISPFATGLQKYPQLENINRSNFLRGHNIALLLEKTLPSIIAISDQNYEEIKNILGLALEGNSSPFLPSTPDLIAFLKELHRVLSEKMTSQNIAKLFSKLLFQYHEACTISSLSYIVRSCRLTEDEVVSLIKGLKDTINDNTVFDNLLWQKIKIEMNAPLAQNLLWQLYQILPHNTVNAQVKKAINETFTDDPQREHNCLTRIIPVIPDQQFITELKTITNYDKQKKKP